MAKRVGVVLAGCGFRDGSEIREAVLTLLSLDRAGAEAICAAPDIVQSRVVDHATGTTGGGQGRGVKAESARIARGPVRDLAALAVEDVDAIIFPGGAGVATVLSNYADKGAICEVQPDVVRLLKGHLSSRRPIGLICMAPILAARVLGPITGVRVTLGPRGTPSAKNAAVMGADVRPAPVRDVVIDQKTRVISTPAYMYDDARLSDVAAGIDKLVRSVLSLARDRNRTVAGPTPALGSV
jgi:enhancing lycopene biosynthesis protein 2